MGTWEPRWLLRRGVPFRELRFERRLAGEDMLILCRESREDVRIVQNEKMKQRERRVRGERAMSDAMLPALIG
jgi:hypothetical protein